MLYGKSRINTILGFLSIIFWSTTIAFSRSLTEQLGPGTTAAYIFLLSGIIGCVYLMLTGDFPEILLRFPPRYLFGCGSLFILYILCLYMAIDLASNRLQTIVVGLINYLWVGLTLVFSIPILKNKANIFLLPGLLIASVGMYLAITQSNFLSWQSFLTSFSGNTSPYILALTAAVLWALFSNLSKKWGCRTKGKAVPVFLLATGLVMLVLRCFKPEHSQLSLRAVFEIFYMATIPTLLAYMFWEKAIQQGNMILVASFSYLIPLLSTLISCIYLSVVPGLNIWLAAIFIFAGAAICKYSIVEEQVN